MAAAREERIKIWLRKPELECLTCLCEKGGFGLILEEQEESKILADGLRGLTDENMEKLRTGVALQLWDKKFVRFDGGEKLEHASGITPYFVDGRDIMSDHTLETGIAILAADQVIKSGKDFDHITGVLTGSTSLANRVGDILGIPKLLIKEEPREHGAERLVNARSTGENLLMIEDLLVTGGSLFRNIDRAYKGGFNTTLAVAIWDREEGASLNAETREVNLQSLFTRTQIFGILDEYRPGVITSEMRESVRSYADLVRKEQGLPSVREEKIMSREERRVFAEERRGQLRQVEKPSHRMRVLAAVAVGALVVGAATCLWGR